MDTSLLESILDECRVEIQSSLERYGINASGRTSASLQVENYFGGVRLISRGENIAPFASLETGNPPEWVNRNALRQWVIEKQIQFNSEEERESFVAAVQWKIAHEGTERHRNPNYEVTTPPIEKAVEEIKKVIPNIILKVFNNGNN